MANVPATVLGEKFLTALLANMLKKVLGNQSKQTGFAMLGNQLKQTMTNLPAMVLEFLANLFDMGLGDQPRQ